MRRPSERKRKQNQNNLRRTSHTRSQISQYSGSVLQTSNTNNNRSGADNADDNLYYHAELTPVTVRQDEERDGDDLKGSDNYQVSESTNNQNVSNSNLNVTRKSKKNRRQKLFKNDDLNDRMGNDEGAGDQQSESQRQDKYEMRNNYSNLNKNYDGRKMGGADKNNQM